MTNQKIWNVNKFKSMKNDNINFNYDFCIAIKYKDLLSLY